MDRRSNFLRRLKKLLAMSMAVLLAFAEASGRAQLSGQGLLCLDSMLAFPQRVTLSPEGAISGLSESGVRDSKGVETRRRAERN